MRTSRARIVLFLTLTVLFSTQVSVPGPKGDLVLVRDCPSSFSGNEVDVSNSDSCEVVDDPNPWLTLRPDPESLVESVRERIESASAAIENWLRSRLVGNFSRSYEGENRTETGSSRR
jgi:hypothetical protein